jgi:hypothetical protein
VERFFEDRSAAVAALAGVARNEDPAHGPSSERAGFEATHGT